MRTPSSVTGSLRTVCLAFIPGFWLVRLNLIWRHISYFLWHYYKWWFLIGQWQCGITFLMVTQKVTRKGYHAGKKNGARQEIHFNNSIFTKFPILHIQVRRCATLVITRLALCTTVSVCVFTKGIQRRKCVLSNPRMHGFEFCVGLTIYHNKIL